MSRKHDRQMVALNLILGLTLVLSNVAYATHQCPAVLKNGSDSWNLIPFTDDEGHTSCFYPVELTKSWNQARQYCQDSHGDLAVMSSAAITAVSSALLNKSNHYFVGLEKASPGSSFYLSVDGTTFQQSDFIWGVNTNGVQEPDGGTAQNCLALIQNDFLLGDIFCGVPHFFVCQLR